MIKLIWDFRGPNAQPIAAHHVTHLKEFVVAEHLQDTICTTEKVSEMYTMATMITRKEYMTFLRERLKPNRGQLYTKTEQ